MLSCITRCNLGLLGEVQQAHGWVSCEATVEHMFDICGGLTSSDSVVRKEGWTVTEEPEVHRIDVLPRLPPFAWWIRAPT